MPEENSNLKKATEAYLQTVLKQKEEQIANSLFDIVVEKGQAVDKTSASMLVVAGAAATLTISNASSILEVLGEGSLSWMFYLLAASSVCGFIGKAGYVHARFLVDFRKALLAVMESVIDDYDRVVEEHKEEIRELVEIDAPQFSAERFYVGFIERLPKLVRRKFEGEKGKNKILAATDVQTYRRISLSVTIQFVMTTAQAALLLIAFLVAVIGIE